MRRIVVLAATTAIVAVVAVVTVVAVVAGGCGVERRASGSGGSNGNGAGGNGGSGNGGAGGSGGFGGGMGVPQNCPGGGTTTLRGTVFAPNGSLPLYDAIVYVPTTPVAAFTDGVTCDRCDGHVSGTPVVWAITGADGTFTMKDTPWGAHVRRQVTLPSVTACQTNPVDATLTRLRAATPKAICRASRSPPAASIRWSACCSIRRPRGSVSRLQAPRLLSAR